MNRHSIHDVFTPEEKEYMTKVLKLGFIFSNMSSEDWIQLEDAVGNRLALHCLDKDYKPNAEGIMCEHILDKLP